MTVENGLDALLRDVGGGGDRREEAALALGLLLERAAAARSGGRGFPLEEVLGSSLAALQLSAPDVDRIVDRLISVAVESRHSSVIWALAASRDPRIVKPLIDILSQILDKPGEERAATHCLQAIAETGMHSPMRREAIGALRAAAETGIGDVKQFAEEFLELRAVRRILDREGLGDS